LWWDNRALRGSEPVVDAPWTGTGMGMGETMNTGGSFIAVLIVDDHTMMAEALRIALDGVADMSVLAIAPTVAAGVEMSATLAPDVVLLDFTMPDAETPEAIEQFVTTRPDTPVLVISSASDYTSVVRTLEAGASGFLLKDQPMSELVNAVRAVHRGERALAPKLVATLMTRVSSAVPARYTLTRREVDVLRLLAEGRSTLDLSRELGLTVNTVRNHVQSAIRRLGAHSKLEAVTIARREGLIPTREMSRRVS